MSIRRTSPATFSSSSEGDYFDILNKKQKNIIEKAIERSLDDNFTGLIFNLQMGSGKTRISLITALALYQQTLIICSKTLLQNWIDEIKNVFGDAIKYEVFHKDYLGDDYDTWTPNANTRLILTTTYPIQDGYIKNNIKIRYISKFNKKIRYQIPRSFRPYLKSTTGDSKFKGVDFFHSNKWDAIFVDEVQNYSNPETTTHQAICSMAVRHRYLLSGTPIVEPSVMRILGLFLLLGVSTLNNKTSVKKLIDSEEWKGFKPYYISINPPKLKTEVVRMTIKYDLNETEVKIYGLFKSLIKNWVEYFHQAPKKDSKYLKIRGHLLALIVSMRISFIDPRKALEDLLYKIKNDPDLILLEPKAKKIERLLMNIDEPIGSKLTSVSVKSKNKTSTRLLELEKILKKKTTNQAIVFSSFTINLNKAVEYLKSLGDFTRPIFMIDGKLSTSKRNEIIKDFRESENGVLFASYSIGSEGLNLQTANTVIYLDNYWNQSKHDQALGRIYRIGQLNEKIYEYDLLTNLKFELYMNQLQQYKSDLSQQIIDPDVKSKLNFKKPVLSILDLADLIIND